MLSKTIKEEYQSIKIGPKGHNRISNKDLSSSICTQYKKYSKTNYKPFIQKVKTQSFQQKAQFDKSKIEKRRVNKTLGQQLNAQELFHPDVYHRPQVRKKYFCQLVDIYMKNQQASKKHNQQLINIQKLNIKKEKEYIFINEYKIQMQKNKNAVQFDSNHNLKRKKRAVTASYTRRQQIAQQSVQNRQKLSKIENIFEQDLNKQKTEEIKQKRRSMVLKSKMNKKLNILNNYLKASQINFSENISKIQTFSPVMAKRHNPETENFSISSHSQTQNVQTQQNDKFISTNLKSQKRQQNKATKINNQPEKSRYVFSPNGKTTSNRQSLSPSNQKSQSLFSNLIHNKSNRNLKHKQIKDQQKTKIQKQLNLRLKLVKSQYGHVNWQVNSFHKHNLYSIYYVTGKQLYQTNSKTISFKNTKDRLKTEPCRAQSKPKYSLKIKCFPQNYQAQKIKNTIQKVKHLGVSNMWSLLPKSNMMDSAQQQILYYSAAVKPLRQQLFQFIKQQKCQRQKSPIYKIHMNPSYYQLFHNNCQYLIDIIISVAKDLIKMKGKVINNKISLDNIYRFEEKDIKVGDWGCSAICRKIMVNGSQIEFKDQPSLKLQKNDNQENLKQNWLLSPENLPPQIVLLLIKGDYSQIWQLDNSPEVWCLGILIFQIITCVPVWMPYNSIVEHRIPKCGSIFDQYKRLSQIYSLQCKIPNILSRWIRDEKDSPVFKLLHPQILILMKSMLQINIKLRPQPQEIIKRLSCIK